MDERSVEERSAGVPDDEISLVAIANTILRNWRIIAVLPVMLTLAVGLGSLSQERT